MKKKDLKTKTKTNMPWKKRPDGFLTAFCDSATLQYPRLLLLCGADLSSLHGNQA
jgi:hypothetical protein